MLFLYLHIHFHLKRSNDLEVYEIDQPSKQRLEEVCDVRQPTTFEYYNEQLLTQLSYQSIHNSYRAFDINIRDVSKSSSTDDSKNTQKGTENDFVLFIPVALKIAHEVLKKDTEMKYISENNADFIEETGLIKTFQLNDEFLRPYMVSKCMYDILMASENTITPLRYDINYRNYFLVTQGSARIMLIPPKDTRYLYPIIDYDIFEFRSPVNPWNIQPEYQDDFDKIKTLEVDLYQGMTMFIPAYWWYSIKFTGSETSICSFKYRTYMNTISIMPQLVMSTLQNMNTKHDTLEKRVIAKNQLQGKTRSSIGSSTNHHTNTPTSNAASTQSTPPEYTPSIEDQYLPKSLRGNSNNPYSIMNSTAINDMSNTRSMATSAVATATVAATAAETAALAPDAITTTIASLEIQSSTPSAEYTPSEKEVTIESSIIQNTTT